MSSNKWADCDVQIKQQQKVSIKVIYRRCYNETSKQSSHDNFLFYLLYYDSLIC